MKNNNKQNRGYIFGIVIQPKHLEDANYILPNWNELSDEKIIEHLEILKFPLKFDVSELFNLLTFPTLKGNENETVDQRFQFEFADETGIPHYQSYIQLKSLSHVSEVRRIINESLNTFNSVEVIYNKKGIDKYCQKATKYLNENYSGRMFKHSWKIDYLEKKPKLQIVLTNPYPWQKYLKEILNEEADDRSINWCVDTVGNVGKSAFCMAYVSEESTDAIYLALDNLDRMTLSLVVKVQEYRRRYNKDPRVIMFDFPRNLDVNQMNRSTCLMENVKSGIIETNFGGVQKEIAISNVHVVVFSNQVPDLSILSKDRWLIWRLSGEKYGNVMLPAQTRSLIKDYNSKLRLTKWVNEISVVKRIDMKYDKNKKYLKLNIPIEFFTKFEDSENSYTKIMFSEIRELNNEVRGKLLEYFKNSSKN